MKPKNQIIKVQVAVIVDNTLDGVLLVSDCGRMFVADQSRASKAIDHYWETHDTYTLTPDQVKAAKIKEVTPKEVCRWFAKRDAECDFENDFFFGVFGELFAAMEKQIQP